MLGSIARSRIAAIMVLVAVLVGAGLSATSGETLGATWSSTSPLPGPLGLESCVTNIGYGYVICVGGLTATQNGQYSSQVEYGNFSMSGGIGFWRTTTKYPLALASESCATYAMSVFCVGGYYGYGLGSPTSAVYSAPVQLNGLGSWTGGPTYPIPIELQSCVTSSGFLYCIGGYNGTKEYSSVYYAQLSQGGGVGAWAKTTSYPINASSLSCVADSGYAYCVGGAVGSTGFSNVYYAALSSSGGVAKWTNTTSYPSTIYTHSCAVSTGFLYCAGGATVTGYTNAVYYAPISASGVGQWVRTTNYPMTIASQSCLTYSGILYCFGGTQSFGMSNAAYYDSINAPPTPTVTSTSTVTSSTTLTLTSTSTRNFTTTSVSTTTSTVSSTSTIFSFLSTTKTSTVTSTAVSTSTVKSVSTSTVTQTSTITNITSTGTAQHGFAVPSPLSQAIPGGIGLAAGVALAFIVTRLIHRGGGPKSQDAPRSTQILHGRASGA